MLHKTNKTMVYWYFKNDTLQYTSTNVKFSAPKDFVIIESEEEPDLTKTYGLVDGKITVTGDAPTLTTEQRTEVQWAEVRAKRNKLLTESDWTQLGDVPKETKELWESYRQELRDVTNQADPYNIKWPVPPQ
jgi:hypothetical protein|tara:strand:- start:104 stop:499 length:396 start_codon:yes stop_codon:yes gene_type:complete